MRWIRNINMHQFHNESNDDSEEILHTCLYSPVAFGELLQLTSHRGAGRWRLNLAGFALLSSAQLGQLVVLNKHITQTGGVLILCKLFPNIYEQLERIGFDHLFQIEDSDDYEGGSIDIPDHPNKPGGGAALAMPETV